MLEYIARFEDYPVSFLKSSQLFLDDDGLPQALQGAVNDNPGLYRVKNINVVVRDGPMLAHYFHFMEIIIAIFCVHKEWFLDAHLDNIYVGNQLWSNPTQNNVQSKIVSAAYPTTNIVTGIPDKHDVENILIFDRWRVSSILNKYLEPFIDICAKHYPKFLDSILASITRDGIATPSRELSALPLRAVYVKRTPPRALQPMLEDEVVSLLIRYGFDTKVVDFAELSWQEQVKSVAHAKLIFGVHGNGLTNIAWMQPKSYVIEIFPVGSFQYDYQILSEVCGLRYFGFEGVSTNGIVARDGGRYGSPGTDPNRSVDQLPWKSLKQVFRQVIDA